ncbi:hypothetical protein NQ160_17285 [Microbacterium sp. zg.Y909]|nr:hypothetical protein [Microbacterium sp. zg.Y909]
MAAGTSALALSACSIDALVWGREGARVIATTDQLVAAASVGEPFDFACDDFVGDFGDAAVWNGLSAGEPEPFDGADSVDSPGLDAAWRINLEGHTGDPGSDEAVPTDVFFREAEQALCVADVMWQRPLY